MISSAMRYVLLVDLITLIAGESDKLSWGLPTENLLDLRLVVHFMTESFDEEQALVSHSYICIPS